MRAFLAITLFAALAIAGCASNNDDSSADAGDSGAGGATNNSTNTTPTPATPTPEGCGGVQPPVGPCIEPPAREQ